MSCRHQFRPIVSALLLACCATSLVGCWITPDDVRERIRLKSEAREARLAEKNSAANSGEADDISAAPYLAIDNILPTSSSAASLPSPQSSIKKPQSSEANLGTVRVIDESRLIYDVSPPSSPLEAGAEWMASASPQSLSRIEAWRSTFEQDVTAAATNSAFGAIGAKGRLFDADSALLYGSLAPGLYSCQIFVIGGQNNRFIEGNSARCLIDSQSGERRISVVTPHINVLGNIYENDAFSAVYLGKGLARAMTPITDGLTLPAINTEEAGLVQRIADTRWRIILPALNASEPTYVLELTSPRPAQ